MLDTETKRRIDSCRDILVGKVPDPKSQVEQITIALIYKFMDDMDIEAEELGGERRFFKGEFNRYAWAKLLASGMGGHEMLALYGEAITKMSENSGIPELFRDIFKNAYLPYRDPETLRSFLKEIDSFKYDHSERLGDAFEYLLSVLGSQGDAGQFRTPRHIIDFMVEITNPQKGEVILDPACGTAGFLISSYKHILKHNSSDYKAAKDRETYDEKGVPLESLTLESPLRYKGDLLSVDERKKLAKDIKGYDISPDMVRLSLVNMYLHGFPEPDIDEYDTLTSEERWNDYADVILANPPFMTPKGGIRPHKRFSIPASRSEVLFVDYIAEHLTPSGRAAIVVPEGIIFQSGGAYKQLREMLVKQSLVAVVSLPAGVFNPYSGVKTSILVMDKRLAKKTDHILFVKIENDGYGLGAQRRPIDKNDLPTAVRGLKRFNESLLNGEAFEPDGFKGFSLVEKTEIANTGDYNLSGERYGLEEAQLSEYDFVSLGNTDLFQVESGGTPKSTEEAYWNGDIYWSTLVDLPATDLVTKLAGTERKITKEGLANSSAKILPPKSILVSSRATIGRIAVNLVPTATNQGFKNIIIKDTAKADPYFVAYMMKQLVPRMEALATGGTFKEISKTQFCTLEIPLPPIDVQQEIVAEIEGYQKIIDGAKQIVTSYQPRIPVNPVWPLKKIGEIAEINPKKSQLSAIAEETPVSFVPMADLSQGEMLFEPKEAKQLGEVIKQYTYFQEDDVLLAKVTPCFENGKSGIARGLTNRLGFGSSEFYVLRPNCEEVLPEWIYFNVITPEFISLGHAQMTGTGGLQRVPKDYVFSSKIALPDIDTQKIIIADIQKEQALVSGNKELIRLFEAKIEAAINRVWGSAE
jgi:type I restriction enzyme M protein